MEDFGPDLGRLFSGDRQAPEATSEKPDIQLPTYRHHVNTLHARMRSIVYRSRIFV